MENTSIAKGAKFLEAQNKVATYINETFSHDHRVELDKLNEPVLWAKSSEEAHSLVKKFMHDENTKIDFLSDLTAYDNMDGVDGDKRFVLVYNLYSTSLCTRIRIKTLIGENEAAQTLTNLFKGANWLEREVFDLFGIKFKGHPNLRRIMMDERFTGHPLRKDYDIKQREPFSDNIPLHLGASPLKIDSDLSEGEEK